MSLHTIDTAIYTALTAGQHTGTPSANAPFALVGRFAGDVSADTITEAVSQWPCALLRFDGESDAVSIDTVGGDMEVRGEASWSVLVGTEDPRSVDDAVSSSNTAVPGALTLIDRVQALLNGLAVGTTDEWRWRRLRCVETRPVLIRRGVVYVYSVRFVALRALPEVAQTDSSVVLTEIRGDVNLQGPSSPPNPLVQFLADT